MKFKNPAMRINWIGRPKKLNDRALPYATAVIQFEPRQFSIETRAEQIKPPLPITIDGQQVGFIIPGSMRSAVERQSTFTLSLRREFPFDYYATLLEAELVGDALIIRAPDEIRNIARKMRRGIA